MSIAFRTSFFAPPAASTGISGTSANATAFFLAAISLTGATATGASSSLLRLLSDVKYRYIFNF
jgi:hypothetical protein